MYKLEFLSFLCSLEQQALDQDKAPEVEEIREAQADFFCNHLFPWAGRFCDRVVKHSRLAYYQLVGAFTKGFPANERTLLEGRLAALPGSTSVTRSRELR